MKLIKYILIAAVLFGGYQIYSLSSKFGEAQEYFAMAVPMLNEVSRDWEVFTLKKHIAKVGFKGQSMTYMKILRKSSHLGSFDVCEDMQMGSPTGLSIDGAVAIVGRCKFDNGKANIQIVFADIEGSKQIVAFLIKPTNA